MGHDLVLPTAHQVGSCIHDRLSLVQIEQLPPEVEQALFRLAQEALANVSRHAEAGQAEIALASTESAITLTIADDGCGFDLEPTTGKGLGLHSMRERIEALGSVLNVESRPGAGTRLVARLELE